MSGLDLQLLLNTGDDLFTSLEQETLDCLKNLESMPAQDIERFVAKRQEILGAIQKFDSTFTHLPDRLGWSADEKGFLKKFRQRQTALLSRVIEADGLLVALAEMGLTSLKADLAGISRGKSALHSYYEEGGASRSSLKRIA